MKPMIPSLNRIAAASSLVALNWLTPQGSQSLLVPFTVPHAGVGTCSRAPVAANAPSGRQELIRYKVDVTPGGTRTIGVGLDSLGQIRTYSETGARSVGPNASTSTMVAARITTDGKVSGFQTLVTARQVADSTKKDPTIRAPLDSTQQRDALRVAEWVRQRCAGKR
jgi:hypothetical protein